MKPQRLYHLTSLPSQPLVSGFVMVGAKGIGGLPHHRVNAPLTHVTSAYSLLGRTSLMA